MATRDHLQWRTRKLCVVTRNGGYLVAGGMGVWSAVSTLATPSRAHLVLVTGLTLWAIARLLTRSTRPGVAVCDCIWAVLAAAVAPVLAGPAESMIATAVAQAIAAVAVATLIVESSRHRAVVLAGTVTAAHLGVAAVAPGGDRFAPADAGAALGAALLLGVGARWLVHAVATRVDAAHDGDARRELRDRIAEASAAYHREQLALLHDTAAATLLLASDVDDAPRQLIARRAARDLTVLRSSSNTVLRSSSDATPGTVDLVATLCAAARFHLTTVRVVGLEQLWLPAAEAGPIAAAVTEALNNVDRHARARNVTIEVDVGRVTVHDDGVGFDPVRVTDGTGLRESIEARMTRIGGAARVHSGCDGTTVVLSWPPGLSDAHGPDLVAGTEAAVRRVAWETTVVGAVAGTVTAIAVLGWSDAAGHLHEATVLAVACAFLIAILLGFPSRCAAALMVVMWLPPWAFHVAAAPTKPLAVSIALGAANLMLLQFTLCAFGALCCAAADDARHERCAVLADDTRKKVADALRSEYQARYASVTARLTPVLRALSGTEPLTPELRDRAGAESRRIRDLLRDDPDEHPVRRAIDAAVRRAEARGVHVTRDLVRWPDHLDSRSADHIRGTVEAALDRAVDFARVVLCDNDGQITASVVHGLSPGSPARSPAEPADGALDGAAVDVFSSGGTAWVSTRIPLIVAL